MRAAQPRASCCPHTAPVVPRLCQVPHCGDTSTEPHQAQRGQEQALCSERPLETAELDPSGRVSSGVSVTLLPSTEYFWLRGSRMAQASPWRLACSIRSGSGGQRREQQGWMQKRQKNKNKKDIDSLGLVSKATGERDSARHHSTSQETDRQTAPCRSDT